jgi:hypothetical protein
MSRGCVSAWVRWATWSDAGCAAAADAAEGDVAVEGTVGTCETGRWAERAA